MQRRNLAVALCVLLAAAPPDAQAQEQRMRYSFEGKKSGNAGVPHTIHAGEFKGLENPAAPKAKELDDAAYRLVGDDKDDHKAAQASGGPQDRAAFLLVFQVEKEVRDATGSWKSLEVEISAAAGPEADLTGAAVVAEVYQPEKKTWVGLANDLPEGWGHRYEIAGPYAALLDREGRIAVRISRSEPGAAHVVALDFARLTLKLERTGADPLTYVSLAGRCKLTRPDDPLWRFEESDDWFIRLVKGEDHTVDITVSRYDSESNYTFGKKSLSGDNAKGLAEAVLENVLEDYKTKDKPKVKKGQIGAYKTQEFGLVGESKEGGELRDIREIFIREKGNTYRISVWGNAATMKQERFAVDRVLKTFVVTE